MNTLTRERLEQIYAECEERDPAITEIRAMVSELQERRKADTAPVYQFRIRNSYNGFTTEWQTLKNREDVDFILKEQPLNSEFRIIGAAPIVPDDYALVPIEPTESMIVDGFESEPDKFFSKPEEWKAYEAMSGCQQAAHRAKLCWSAMLAAAPKPE